MIASLCILACSIAAALAAEEGDLIVTSPPHFISQPPQLLPYRVGEKVVLECHAEGEPQPTYSWKKNRIDYNPGELDNRAFLKRDSGTLNILNTRDLDEGDYQCTATNGFGSAVSEKVFLRKAILNVFPKSPPQEYRVTEGQSLTLACTPPTSFPQATYYWSFSTEGSANTPVPNSPRVVVDEKVSGNIPQRPITKMYSTGTNTIVGRVGTTTQMQCVFAGYPTPNVRWEWDKTPQNTNRYTTTMHDTILKILNTQKEDEGQIRCIATNANTDVPVSTNFNLKVQSKPMWVQKPVDVNAAEDEDVEFPCIAEGTEVNIDWFINGVPLGEAPPNPRRSLEKDKIVYRSLLKTDVGVIQCNASNVHGWVYANAFLNVLADPPSITQRLPATMKFPDGKTVQIKCNFFGAPKPIISWSKDGRELSGGRFSPLDNGVLEIMNIQATDAGKYQCRATNKFGEAVDETDVYVRRPTRVKVPPADTTVIRGKEAKFTCEGETDPMETLTISWQKDGQDINYGSTQRISQNTWDNSILISGTNALDTGLYTCVASNGLDTSTASARLIVQAEPLPPTSIQIQECRSRSATIRWQPGPDNNAPILNYIIEYNTTFSPWQVAHDNVSSAETEQDIALSPWGLYKFRVLARNIIGTSLQSEPSTGECKTDPAKPDKNPDNVRTLDMGANKLVIAWSPMPPIEQNGPNMHYSITFQRVDIDNAPLNTTRIENPQVMELIHQGTSVPVYTPYKITVKAINGFGDATQSVVPIIGFSGEGSPSQVVSDFSVDKDSIKGTEATFQWTGVEEGINVTNGFFVGYRITYWKLSEPENKLHMDVIKRDRSTEAAAYANLLNTDRKKRALGDAETATIYNLPAFSDVRAHIRVINKNYAGQPSRAVNIKTKEGVPGPPINLHAIEIGPNHVIIKWDVPQEPNGRILGYNVEYQRVIKMTQDTRQQRQPQINNPDATQAKVWSLESRQKYTIYLAARTSMGPGEETFIEVVTGAPGAPGKPSMKIVGVYDNALNVTWTPSTDKTAKPASAFYVQYRKTESTEWQRTPYESDFNWANVTNLDPGYIYEVRVVASNGADYETESDSEEVAIQDTREIAGSVTNVAGASWFIALMVIIAVFVIILIIVCVVRQNRGEKYPVIENELLRGQPHQEDRNFGEFTRPEEPYRKSQGSLNSDIKPGIESDNDSMAAYDDDPSKFTEDGSFIGQYGAKKQPPPDPETKESAMSTFV